MKKAIVLILMFSPLCLIAQTNNSQADTLNKETNEIHNNIKCDTLYLFGGEKLYVDVKKISFDSIIYRETHNNKRQALKKDKGHKIKHSWGELEYITDSPVQENESFDWRKVKIVGNEINVKNKYRVEKLEASVKGNSYLESPKVLVKKAQVILRKRAANLNAKYILIVNKTVSMAFGEIPSASLTGIAYADNKIENQKDSW